MARAELNLVVTNSLMMSEEFFEELPPEPTPWNREALDHLSADLHRSKAQMSQLLAEEESRPAFNPLKVRDLIRQCSREGREPAALVLGQIETASFRHFVSRGFGEESGSHLRNKFFMGLTVLEDSCPTRLEIIDEESEDNSAHAPHLAA